MEEGRKNLKAADWKVDFVFTHCCASSTAALIGQGAYETDSLTDYFEEIRTKLDFKKWFFGHYHDNRNINTQEILLYEQFVPIYDRQKASEEAFGS